MTSKIDMLAAVVSIRRLIKELEYEHGMGNPKPTQPLASKETHNKDLNPLSDKNLFEVVRQLREGGRDIPTDKETLLSLAAGAEALKISG